MNGYILINNKNLFWGKFIIMNKKIKYLGITSAMLLATAPIAAPVINSTTETVVQADTNDVNQSDVNKWLGEIKSTINLTKNSSLITNEEIGTYYVFGSDGLFFMYASDLTPEESMIVNSGDSFFKHFNDNSNGDDTFFNNYQYGVIITATATDNSVSGNLIKDQANELLSEGKSVTFHLSLRHTQPAEAYSWDSFINEPVLGTKDVVVNPAKSETSNVKVPGTGISELFESSVNSTVYDDNGKATTITLPKTSVWNVDRQMNINGTTFYRVANNEWVKKDDGLAVTLNETTVNTNKQASLYTSQGKKVTNRALAKNTPWYSDRMATINGQTMYRVATDEWVMADDIK